MTDDKYDEIPKDFLQWSQAERDDYLDARDRHWQRRQFDTTPSAEIVDNLVLVCPASSCADPASPFRITVRAAKEFVQHLQSILDSDSP